MDSYDIARIVAIGMSLVLVIAGLKGRAIGLGDGLRMAALWAFVIIAVALVFTVIGW